MTSDSKIAAMRASAELQKRLADRQIRGEFHQKYNWLYPYKCDTCGARSNTAGRCVARPCAGWRVHTTYSAPITIAFAQDK